MIASGFLVFFLCALVGCSLFYVVTLQFQLPVVKRRPKRRANHVASIKTQPTATKTKRAPQKKRKRKRKIQETPVKNIIRHTTPPPPHENVASKMPEPEIIPDIPKIPEKASVDLTEPPQPVIFSPPKQVKVEEKNPPPNHEKFTSNQVKIEQASKSVPQIERVASISVETKSDDLSSDFDFLLDAKESDLSNSNCIEMYRDRSKSDSNLLSNNSSKRKPPLVYNSPPYNEKNMREQKKQKREKPDVIIPSASPSTLTVSKASAYTSEQEMNQSPSPPGGESSSSDSSAKTTDSFEKERAASQEPTQPSPPRTDNRMQTSHSMSHSPVKRSLSSRSLHHHSQRRHYSKSHSQPNSPVRDNSHVQSHRNSRRRLRKQSKKKNRVSRSYSHSHLSHVHGYHTQTMPVQNRQMPPPPQFAHMPHFPPQPFQMQAFVPPPPPVLHQTFSGNLEFDQNNLLHPLQQIKPDTGPDLGVGHQQVHAFMPHQPQMQPQFIMTEIQQPHIPIVHQPQLPPQPISPQVVFHPIQHPPMSPHVSSGGLSHMSMNSIPSPVFYQHTNSPGPILVVPS